MVEEVLYERTVEAKTRRIENNDRMSAASSLLSLSEEGNATRHCEPHTGLSSQDSTVHG